MVSSVTEEQIKSAYAFAKKTPHLNERNNILGKLGEVAFHNLIQTIGFENAYGNDLHNSIFKTLAPFVRDDGGIDYMLQSKECKYIKLLAQIKTTTDAPNHKNIILKKSMYDSKLNYDTKYCYSPVDIFVLVKQLSESTYDVVGFITSEDALLCLKDGQPVKDCYGIHESNLRPIEELQDMIKEKSCK